jgi:uncharacterized protein YdeI (YjbR/CyaY-like superfamily)
MVKFTSLQEIVATEAILKDYIHEAVDVARAGLKVELKPDDFELPAELIEKLVEDPALKAAFEALTPGRRRGYAIYFGQPKQAKTRLARIEQAEPRIFAGRGIHDR